MKRRGKQHLIGILIFLVLFFIGKSIQSPVYGEEITLSPDHAFIIEACLDNTLQIKNSLLTNEPIVNIVEKGPIKWKLIWNDEFTGRFLNIHKWTAVNMAYPSNNELQYYLPDNVKVENGLLRLISKKETYENKEYTSGAVQTKDTFTFRYGKVEMRAKLPSGQGIFPAFWMLTDHKETWLPEIDIVEMLGHNPKEIWNSLHRLNKKQNLTSLTNSYSSKNFALAFHTYSLEWSSEKIDWFVDGVKTFSVTNSVPKEEMYLYINTAIGGNWPGNPDKTTEFPTDFEVDYIRIFSSTF